MSEFPKTGAIIGYRRSKRIIHPNFVIIKFDEITNRKDAAKLIGKQVIWRSPAGKRKTAYITRIHGITAPLLLISGKLIAGYRFGEKIELKI